MKDNFLLLDGFTAGWHKRDDDTRIPLGGARLSTNIMLTDRKGISPRPGEELLGTANSTSTGVRSAWSFHKSQGDDILVKSYSDKLEFYSNEGSDWSLIYDGYSTSRTIGFAEARIDANESIDWLYFGNGVGKFSRWCGYDTLLNGALVGGETTVTVDSTLLPEVQFSGTASATTTTTLDISASDWSSNAWNGFYVYITSGAAIGKISLISATTATQITFAAIALLAGTPTFEIRQIAVPATGTLVYGNNKVVYTAVPSATEFTVSSASAAADNTILTIAPQTYAANPKGGILTTFLDCLVVAGDPSKPNTLFRSKLANASDFTYTSPRAAGEGDVVYFPYSGGSIMDVKRFEDTLVVLKEDSIESLTWSLDAVDLAQQDSIKVGQKVGTIAKAWTMDDDLAFVTPDNRITSLGRIKSKDTRPQTQDIAYSIRRGIKDYDFSSVFGAEYVNRAFVGCKSSVDVTANDRTLVWNKDYATWEGYWFVPAAVVVPHDGDLYYGDAYNPDIYQMMTGVNKIKSGETYPMSARWVSGWINGKGSGFYLNEISSLAIEGYIRLNTTITFKLYKDFSLTAFQELQLVASTDADAIDGEVAISFLGGSADGLEPLGVPSILGDDEGDGYRHFLAYLQFPITQIEYVSVEVSSSGTNQGWEVTRLGLNATENVFEAQNRVIS